MSMSPNPFWGELAVSVASLQETVFDALIVGAGPAGASAAYHLARAGHHVLLVDKARFPRKKPCGDALMPPALEELTRMGVLEAVQSQFQAIGRIHLWQGKMEIPAYPILPPTASEQAGGYVAPREQFDALLVAHAIAAGAQWRDQLSVESIEHMLPDTVVVRARLAGLPQTLLLRTRLLIAADGAGSRLARQVYAMLLEAGESTPLAVTDDSKARFTAVRGYLQQVASLSDELEFYFQQQPAIFYHWVFPVNLAESVANVGLIATTQQWRTGKRAHQAPPEAALEEFCRTPLLQTRIPQLAWQGPIQAAPVASGMRGKLALYGPRFLCVGEAAALVDPQSAEGISEALCSGRIASEIGSVALRQDRFDLKQLAPYGEGIRTRYLYQYDAALQAMS